jgi:predicted ribonuclease YlaK
MALFSFVGRRFMATKKRAALFEGSGETSTTQRTNSLKLKLDDMSTIQPKSETQRAFFEAYARGHYFMCLHGVAGTGKSYIALYKALEDVLDRSTPFGKVVIIRSAVQSREMGYLPGGVDEKMEVYIQPYRQITTDLFSRKDAWDRLCEQGHVEFLSTSFIRGTTFSNSIILVDEFQNCNFEELDTVITRVGHTSKIIFCGDVRQTDLKKKDDKSGLNKFLNIAGAMKQFSKFEFTVDDICRSSLVKDYIVAKMTYEDGEQQ